MTYTSLSICAKGSPERESHTSISPDKYEQETVFPSVTTASTICPFPSKGNATASRTT